MTEEKTEICYVLTEIIVEKNSGESYPYSSVFKLHFIYNIPLPRYLQENL